MKRLVAPALLSIILGALPVASFAEEETTAQEPAAAAETPAPAEATETATVDEQTSDGTTAAAPESTESK